MDISDADLGRAIEAARIVAQIGQQELSDRLRARGLNWSRVTLSKVETGNRTVKAAELPTLLDALGAELGDLFENAGDELRRGLSHAHHAAGYARAQRWQLEQVAGDVKRRLQGVCEQERSAVNVIALYRLMILVRDDPDSLRSMNWGRDRVLELSRHALGSDQQAVRDWLAKHLAERTSHVQFDTDPEDDRLLFEVAGESQ